MHWKRIRKWYTDVGMGWDVIINCYCPVFVFVSSVGVCSLPALAHKLTQLCSHSKDCYFCLFHQTLWYKLLASNHTHAWRIYIYVYIYIHTHTRAYIYIFTHIHIYTYTCTHIDSYVHICWVYTYISLYLSLYSYRYSCIYQLANR